MIRSEYLEELDYIHEFNLDGQIIKLNGRDIYALAATLTINEFKDSGYYQTHTLHSRIQETNYYLSKLPTGKLIQTIVYVCIQRKQSLKDILKEVIFWPELLERKFDEEESF
jgi:hypothetical protein